jgi:organic radical activating enzyme
VTALEPGIFGGHRTLSIMPTYQCTAACDNCASMSSPKVKDTIPLETIISAIDQAHELGFYNVVFTGGETTLRWNDLLTAITHAKSLGFPTRIVTNAHWAWSVERADEKLRMLIEAGLDEINYSTGDEHVRFVPIERIVNAIVAATALDFRVWVMVELRSARNVTAATIREHPRIVALPQAERDLIDIGESPWMPLDPTQIENYPAGVAADRGMLKAHLPCDNVLQTFTVQADGKVGSCCGIGMRFIPELNVATVDQPEFLRKAIEDSENDFLKVWMHYKGPEKVLAWAAEKDPSIEWQGMYAHRCQACARVYQDPAVRDVIIEHHEEMLAEVIQSAWFDERYAGQLTRLPVGQPG